MGLVKALLVLHTGPDDEDWERGRAVVHMACRIIHSGASVACHLDTLRRAESSLRGAAFIQDEGGL
jgi:hypothetical protein